MSTSIENFANNLGLKIQIQYPIVRINNNKYWGATLINSEGKRASFKDSDTDPSNLGAIGVGKTPNQAIDDLCKVYRGKILVLKQNQLRVPHNLSF